MHKLVTAGYACSVAAIGQVCAKHNIKWAYETTDTAFIVDARNNLVEKFLANPERTHLLMMDSDSQLSFQAVEKIVTCGYDFASLPFCMRVIDLEKLRTGVPLASALNWCVDLAPGEQKMENGWFQARRTGFGCVLLARRVLEAFPGGWFDRMMENDILLSEDMSFCERVKDVAQPMLCVDQTTYHNGTFSFGARLLDDTRYFARVG